MRNETGYFEGRELKKLFYQSWLPDEEPKAYLIAIHDLTTHSDRLMTVAEYFTDKGYALYSFDLRGHYRNKSDNPGHIESMDYIQKDIVLFMDVVKKYADEKKIFLMGHSFGGLITLIYAINHPRLPGVIISSPSLEGYLESILGKKAAKKLTGRLASNKNIKLEIDQNQLTSDLKILRKHIADKNKLEIITAKSAFEIINSIKWVNENIPKLLCPIIIQQAGNDKLTDPKVSRRIFERVKSEDKTYKEYDGFLHELWSEKGRAQVFQDLFVWVEKHNK